MLQEDIFFRPNFGEQIPSHPGLYQVIPWELTKSGNYLKNKDPQVQVRATTDCAVCCAFQPCCAVLCCAQCTSITQAVVWRPRMCLLLECCCRRANLLPFLLLYCCQRIKLYFVGLHSAEPHEVDMTRVYSFDSDTRELVSHTPKVLGADDLSSILDPVMRIR